MPGHQPRDRRQHRSVLSDDLTRQSVVSSGAQCSSSAGPKVACGVQVDQVVDLGAGQSPLPLEVGRSAIWALSSGEDVGQDLHGQTEVVRRVRKPSLMVHTLLSISQRGRGRCRDGRAAGPLRSTEDGHQLQSDHGNRALGFVSRP